MNPHNPALSDADPNRGEPPVPAFTPLIDVDWSTFDPWRIHLLRHNLVGHPLLEPSAMVELGERLESSGRVRTHTNAAAAGTSFTHAPSLHPNRRSAAATLSDIAGAGAWMSLLNVQTDFQYRPLVDEALDSIQPGIERVDPGMCYRGGWIFVSSPRTVTPFHFDREHNFLLQVRGHKTIYAWDPDDTVVASERARDRFFAFHDRDLLVWNDRFKERAHKFELAPGMGCYMPSTSPHLVEVGDTPSITMSVTYYTASMRRKAMLHTAHQRLRDYGVEMAPVGRQPFIDTALYIGYRAYASAKQALRRFAGKPVIADDLAYAYPR